MKTPPERERERERERDGNGRGRGEVSISDKGKRGKEVSWLIGDSYSRHYIENQAKLH